MHSLCLIGSSATPLAPDFVASLQRDLCGGDTVWLSPGEAVEFEVETPPDDFEAHAEAVRGQGVDVAILPAEGRRKRLLLADMDSTMIGQECIDELADAAGVGERVADITARAMNGELNFEEALLERVGL
ncbi:MAG: phosphoserine phosphatase SerB, partial [Pseudomonadota bacterium]